MTTGWEVQRGMLREGQAARKGGEGGRKVFQAGVIHVQRPGDEIEYANDAGENKHEMSPMSSGRNGKASKLTYQGIYGKESTLSLQNCIPVSSVTGKRYLTIQQ